MGQFTLHIADRLSTAQEFLAHASADIILLDLSLPDSHGLDTIVKLRHSAAAIPIIVLTGLDDENLALETIDHGAQDYLVKGTVNGALLARSIRYAIQRFRSKAELKATQLQLIQAEKLQSLGQMAASVAHEVKNPLAILHMGIECLDEHFFGDNDQMNIVVSEMKEAVIRAESVIRDMLDYSSARDLELRQVCVNSLITQTLRFVRHDLNRGKVSVVTHLAEDLPSCLLDAPKIEQVLVNVFINACHAMPDGGLLTIHTFQRVFETDDPEPESRDGETVRFRTGDKAVVVAIRDTGTGIPEEKLRKIFDPFFTTKIPGKGTGLGLSVVKKIIDLHGGKIDIANADGGGARVTIALKPDPQTLARLTGSSPLESPLNR
jgi:signal transduction histidine kinase